MADNELTLVALSVEDVEFMLQLTCNREVTRYLNGLIGDQTSMSEWIKSLEKNDYEMIIQLTDSGAKIGECSLTISNDGQSGEIGYMIHPIFWRKGYGTETVRLLIELAKELGLSSLTAMTSPYNLASVKILEKHSFVRKCTGWFLTETSMDMDIDNARLDCFVLHFDNHESHNISEAN